METSSCLDCQSGLTHCHDTLVVHDDTSVTCMGWESCLGDPALHGHLLFCSERECRCTLDRPESLRSFANAALAIAA